MQDLRFTWVTLSAEEYDGAQSEVGLYKYSVLNVGMLDVSCIVWVLFTNCFCMAFI